MKLKLDQYIFYWDGVKAYRSGAFGSMNEAWDQYLPNDHGMNAADVEAAKRQFMDGYKRAMDLDGPDYSDYLPCICLCGCTILTLQGVCPDCRHSDHLGLEVKQEYEPDDYCPIDEEVSRAIDAGIAHDHGFSSPGYGYDEES